MFAKEWDFWGGGGDMAGNFLFDHQCTVLCGAFWGEKQGKEVDEKNAGKYSIYSITKIARILNGIN